MIEVRRATRDDVEPLSAALARAFLDDPVMIWLMGGEHVNRLSRFFAADVRHYLRRCEVLTAGPDHEGGALWAQPGQWRMHWADLLRAGPALIGALGRRLPAALRALTTVERAHPREPHWYLAVLGTDPPAQGKGVGAALLQPTLDRCDRMGTGSYLESSKEQNIPYYQRFGFRVTGEIALPDGPTVWSMWRDPA